MKTIAVISNPTTQGSVIASPLTATLNNKPIATLGSIAIHDKLGADAVKDGIGGVLLNGKPISFVGASTILGQTIIDAGATTASITGATHYGLPECPMIAGTVIEETEEKDITVCSDYARQALFEMATDLAEATFCYTLTEIYGEDIKLHAYAELYRDASEKKIKQPKIVVIKNKVIKYAAFHKHKQEIHVNENLVKKATEGKDPDAMMLLYAALNEEFGHYIDWLLRHEYTQRGGDNPLDEGAAYGMLLASINLLNIKEIPFGTATIAGTSYPLKLDLSTVHEQLHKAKKIYEQEMHNDTQTKNYKFFGAGKGNPDQGFYGHYGIEEALIEDDKIQFSREHLNFTYLGNFLRDYSQLLSGTFMGFTQKERAQVEKGLGEKNARQLFTENNGRWLNPIKPTRETLTYLVDILAAKETMANTPNEALETFKDSIESDNPVIKKVTELGFSIAQIPFELKQFHKTYTTVTPELLGVYRPEEHMDNPIATHVIDTLKEDYLFCPEGTNPSINQYYGCKDYIRSYDTEKDKERTHVKVDKNNKTHINGKTDYLKGLPTSVTYIRQQLDFMEAKATRSKPNEALIHLGNALHVLEDFFAHTNFVELSIMKVSGKWFFPWVDTNCHELVNFNPQEATNRGKHFGLYNRKKDPDINRFFVRNTERGEVDFFDHDGLINSKVTFGEFKELCRRVKEKDPSIEAIYYTVEGSQLAYPGIPTSSNYTITNIYYVEKGICYHLKPLDKFHEAWKNRFYSIIENQYGKDITLEKYLIPETTFMEITEGVNIYGNANKVFKSFNQIPLVTGLFRGEDALFSLKDKLLSMLSPEEFEFSDITGSKQGVPFDPSKFSAYALTMHDMMMLILLDDLSKKQHTEADRIAAHTGRKVSTYLEDYKDYIKYRQMIFSVIEGLPKLSKFVKAQLIEMLKKASKNFTKSVLRGMLITHLNAFKDKQGAKNKLGTNPSHSQLAKDTGAHHLHGLAAELAIIAVKDIGRQAHRLIFQREGHINTLKDRMSAYFAHPEDVNWMDMTVYKWLAKQELKKNSIITNMVGKDSALEAHAHGILGLKPHTNKYKAYKEETDGYVKTLQEHDNIAVEPHHHHHEEDKTTAKEALSELGKEEKDEENSIDILFKELENRPELFIDDMSLDKNWSKQTVKKMFAKTDLYYNQIHEIFNVIKKSEATIEAFKEEAKSLTKETTETTEEVTKEIIDVYEKAIDDFMKIKKEAKNEFNKLMNKSKYTKQIKG